VRRHLRAPARTRPQVLVRVFTTRSKTRTSQVASPYATKDFSFVAAGISPPHNVFSVPPLTCQS
jgi:hypothetical protein